LLTAAASVSCREPVTGFCHGIVETLTKNRDGSLGPLTGGSTQAVRIKVTHAGVREVEVWSFDLDGHPKR
jgi:hypothetical protein